MLRSMESLIGIEVQAYDGAIGEVVDFCFDAVEWTTRYFVLDSSGFMPGKWLVVPPVAFDKTSLSERVLQVYCTKQEISQIQPLVADSVTSRREEEAIYRHFELPLGRPSEPTLSPSFGMKLVPSQTGRAKKSGTVLKALHQFKEIQGFAVQGADGKAGTLSDFLVEDGYWDQRLVVVRLKTRKTRVAAPVALADPVQWEAKTLTLSVPVRIVSEAPKIEGRETLEGELGRSVAAYYDNAIQRYHDASRGEGIVRD
ncbi:MAG TPA: hypothetical protein HPP83_00775 [Candidatus Hydrogenedentes bacterium]|nr:hypothetical protein [Candidatus Hydrogenedentota bacterium]